MAWYHNVINWVIVVGFLAVVGYLLYMKFTEIKAKHAFNLEKLKHKQEKDKEDW